MQIEVTAKPLEWDEPADNGSCAAKDWTDSRMGFGITFDPAEPAGSQFCASWGEVIESDAFATLEEAKKWCQLQADDWILEHALVKTTPIH